MPHLWGLSSGRLVEGRLLATPDVTLKVFSALSAPAGMISVAAAAFLNESAWTDSILVDGHSEA